MPARTASAGSVEEETGDRGGRVLLAERRRRREHADDQSDERLGQARARDVVADVAVGLALLEEPAQRLGERAVEAVGVGSSTPACQQHEWVSHVHQRAHGAGDALGGRHRVDPG